MADDDEEMVTSTRDDGDEERPKKKKKNKKTKSKFAPQEEQLPPTEPQTMDQSMMPQYNDPYQNPQYGQAMPDMMPQNQYQYDPNAQYGYQNPQYPQPPMQAEFYPQADYVPEEVGLDPEDDLGAMPYGLQGFDAFDEAGLEHKNTKAYQKLREMRLIDALDKQSSLLESITENYLRNKELRAKAELRKLKNKLEKLENERLFKDLQYHQAKIANDIANQNNQIIFSHLNAQAQLRANPVLLNIGGSQRMPLRKIPKFVANPQNEKLTKSDTKLPPGFLPPINNTKPLNTSNQNIQLNPAIGRQSLMQPNNLQPTNFMSPGTLGTNMPGNNILSTLQSPHSMQNSFLPGMMQQGMMTYPGLIPNQSFQGGMMPGMMPGGMGFLPPLNPMFEMPNSKKHAKTSKSSPKKMQNFDLDVDGFIDKYKKK